MVASFRRKEFVIGAGHGTAMETRWLSNERIWGNR